MRSMHLDPEKSYKRMRFVAEVLLVVALVGFMGAYFWMSFRGERAQTPIQENFLTPHDDLLDLYGGTGGQAWAVGKNGLILHTKDGGRSWKHQPSNTTQALLAISFAQNRQVGFAVGNGGIILSTEDGGLSWKVAQGSGAIGKSEVPNSLFGVQAVSKTKAHAVGAFGTLLSTSDGGKNWMKCKFSWEKLTPRLVQTISAQVEPNLNALYFVSEKIGWVVGEFGLVLHTRDGGQTWTSQRSGPDLPVLFAVIFLDEHRGWAMGQLGSFIWTKDGGKNWLPCNVDINRDLYAACFEGGRMVVVGNRIFLKTENEGSTWTRKDFTENLVLNGVALMSNVATAVGQSGVITQIK